MLRKTKIISFATLLGNMCEKTINTKKNNPVVTILNDRTLFGLFEPENASQRTPFKTKAFKFKSIVNGNVTR